MMDFLKQNGDSEIDRPAEQGKERLEAELGSDSSFVTTTPREKHVKNGTIVFVAVFCVSLACLWFMIKKTTPQAAAAKSTSDETQIENAIAKITGTKAEFFKSVDSVIGKFHEFSSVPQVKVTELQKNPFEHQNYSSTSLAERQGQSESERERSMKFELERGATGMQLLSIMKSSRGNCCMINDKMLRKGDTFEGWTVTAIADKSVELSANGMQKTLTISSD